MSVMIGEIADSFNFTRGRRWTQNIRFCDRYIRKTPFMLTFANQSYQMIPNVALCWIQIVDVFHIFNFPFNSKFFSTFPSSSTRAGRAALKDVFVKVFLEKIGFGEQLHFGRVNDAGTNGYIKTT